MTSANIVSSRPLQVAKLFHGKTVAETLRSLPRLYSLCGTAQACSAVRACEQALGISVDPATDSARDLLVWAETAREHMWRILLDWPTFVGESADHATLTNAIALLKRSEQALFKEGDPFQLDAKADIDHDAFAQLVDALDALIERAVTECVPTRWPGGDDADELVRWSESAATPAARLLRKIHDLGWQSVGATETVFLPVLDGERLGRCFREDRDVAFVAQPSWEDQCRETTPLARQNENQLIRSITNRYGAGLLARLAARLAELTGIPEHLRRGITQLQDPGRAIPSSCPECARGVGIGQTEAARGRLIHYVETQGDMIQRYQILAPTEWNFHPDGVVACGLRQLLPTSHEHLREQATLWVNAVDPCVGYSLSIH